MSPEYQLVVAASAERSLRRLPESAAAAIVEFLVGDLVASPRRVGHPLHRELARLWSGRRGPYRVVYEIDDDLGAEPIGEVTNQARRLVAAQPHGSGGKQATRPRMSLSVVNVLRIDHRSDVYRSR